MRSPQYCFHDSGTVRSMVIGTNDEDDPLTMVRCLATMITDLSDYGHCGWWLMKEIEQPAVPRDAVFRAVTAKSHAETVSQKTGAVMKAVSLKDTKGNPKLRQKTVVVFVVSSVLPEVIGGRKNGCARSGDRWPVPATPLNIRPTSPGPTSTSMGSTKDLLRVGNTAEKLHCASEACGKRYACDLTLHCAGKDIGLVPMVSYSNAYIPHSIRHVRRDNATLTDSCQR